MRELCRRINQRAEGLAARIERFERGFDTGLRVLGFGAALTCDAILLFHLGQAGWQAAEVALRNEPIIRPTPEMPSTPSPEPSPVSGLVSLASVRLKMIHPS